MDDGFLRIETNIDYRGPVDEFLGRSFSDDKGNSGQDIEYRTTLTKEPTYVDFDGNGTPGETISGSGRAVRVQENTETFDGQTTSQHCILMLPQAQCLVAPMWQMVMYRLLAVTGTPLANYTTLITNSRCLVYLNSISGHMIRMLKPVGDSQ